MASDATISSGAGSSLAAGRGRARQVRQIRRVLTGALVVLLGYLCVTVVFAILTPISRPSADAPLREAEARPVDLTVFTRFDPFKGNAPAVAPEIVETAGETRLNLKLVGVFLGDPSTATIVGQNGRQDVYGVSEEIAQGVSVREIRSDHILIDRQGVVESLSLENRDRGLRQGPQGGSAGRVASSFQSFSEYLRVEPSPEGGLVISPGADRRFFDAAGFVAGDRVIAVDGIGLSTGGAQLANLPSRLRQGPVEIIVERDGTRIELQTDLTGLSP